MTAVLRSRKLRSGVIAILILLCLALALLVWRAPQIFVLAGEGFPGATWPASGKFALVEGAAGAMDSFPAAPPPPEPARKRFAESGGRALLVERGGVLEAELYREGSDRDTRLNSYSLVKSLVGALTLRGLADGVFDSLDMPIQDLLGPDAPDVSLGEVLTMSSGLAMADEPPKSGETVTDDAGFSPFAPLARIHAYGIENTMADLRVDKSIEGTFHYQSANTALLGLALEKAYGRPLADLLSEFIWKPAGAEDAYWRLYPAGEGVSAYCCLYARPLDWVLVGRYLMDNGMPSQPFLPEKLWQEYLLPELDADVRRSGFYGDQVHHDVLDREGEAANGSFAYFSGLSGQMVYLLPGLDAVVVRFGEKPQLLHSTLYELFPDG